MSDSRSPLGGDPSSLRRLNLQAILRVIHNGGAHTITELSGLAHVSRPTAKQAVDDLVASGWIGLADVRADGAMGRPAQVFEFRPAAGHVLGVDVGAHKVVALIADLAGTIVARARRPVDPTLSATERLAAMDEVVEEALSMYGADRPITHAVVATPGTVDEAGNIVYNTVMPEWLGSNPSAWLAGAHPSLDVCAADDMSMSAVAERWLGSARGVDDVVYLHLGRRLGIAALIGGRPHVGHHRAAPQVGVWRATAWRTDYSSLLRIRPGDPASGSRELFTAAAAGDEDARDRIATFADEIVAGAIPFIIAIDPQLVVVGGGISEAGEAIVGPVRDRIVQETPFAPDVVASSLGDEAVALGAVRLALDAAEEQLFSTISVPAKPV